jgi:hypothetical protein
VNDEQLVVLAVAAVPALLVVVLVLYRRQRPVHCRRSPRRGHRRRQSR